MPVPATGFRASGKALATAANTNVLELRAPATARPRVTELKVWSEAATALALAVFRATVVGTAGTNIVPDKDDPGLAPALASCSTLPTGGTPAAVALERAFLPASVGASVAFYWPDGILVPTSGSLIVRNDGAIGPAITWSLVWVED